MAGLDRGASGYSAAAKLNPAAAVHGPAPGFFFSCHPFGIDFDRVFR